MRSDQWARVGDLMEHALQVPETERSAWIQEQAGGDAELAAEVIRLLDAHAEAGPFLDVPLIESPGAAIALQAALPDTTAEGMQPGTLLGNYRVLREIGRGGMGTVYLAARADDAFAKQVAIKIVPGAVVSAGLRQRFARERDVLASLEHVGIARILDGGTTVGGLPYLVMEYVDGQPIDAYCDTHGLDVAARLQLFTHVCRAVHYAHGRFVVHRDIKARNVLVGRDGQPKLLDFGIAKLLSHESSGDQGATLTHAWTPESASPEQVRGQASTIATDVYGLGALLYRLVTGRPVFELSGRDPFERARIICDVPPARASVAAAANGGPVPPAMLAGDLDVILLKALHKEPGGRYQSAEHFAEDVERHLANRPVLAAPDRWLYRAHKFVARHSVATAAIAVGTIVLLGACAVALWQAHRAEQERARAQATLDDVRRLASTLIFDVYDRVENSPNATSIRRSLVQSGLGYLDRVASDAPSNLVLSLELADAYRRLAQVQGDRGRSNLGDRDGAASSLEKARVLLAPFFERDDAPVEVGVAYFNVTRQLALTVADQPERSRQLTDESLRLAPIWQQRYPRHDALDEIIAHTWFNAALTAKRDERLRLWEEAGRVYRELASRSPDNANHVRSLALTEKYIGSVHHDARRFDAALAHYQRALELDKQLHTLKPDNRQTTIDMSLDLGNVASILWESDPPQLQAAAALYRESLALREWAAAQDREDVYARQALAYCLLQLSSLSRQLRDVDAAIAYGRRAVDAYESLPSSEHLVRRGNAWLALGRAVDLAGRREEGCVAFRNAQKYFEQAATASPHERQALPPDAATSVREALGTCPH